MTSVARIGIIGGSGLYQIDGFQFLRYACSNSLCLHLTFSRCSEESISTPFGQPSDAFKIFSVSSAAGKVIAEVVFLPRHGRNHVVNPSEVCDVRQCTYRHSLIDVLMFGL